MADDKTLIAIYLLMVLSWFVYFYTFLFSGHGTFLTTFNRQFSVWWTQSFTFSVQSLFWSSQKELFKTQIWIYSQGPSLRGHTLLLCTSSVSRCYLLSSSSSPSLLLLLLFDWLPVCCRQNPFPRCNLQFPTSYLSCQTTCQECYNTLIISYSSLSSRQTIRFK